MQCQKQKHSDLMIELEIAVSTRKNMALNYSKIHNIIHKGGTNDNLQDIIQIIGNRKALIAILYDRIRENKKKIKSTKVELSKLVK